MKLKRFDVIRIIFTACYLFSAGVLIFEACQNGTSSSNRSNFVGGTIANLINGIGGDQTVEVAPTSLNINNKVSEVFVGDELTLLTTTLPEDATNKSVNFTSDNPSVVSVTSGGYVKFLKQGTATITAENINYPSIKDTMNVTVSNVEVETLKSTINAPFADDIYTLTVGKTYDITNVIEPLNATFQTVTYEKEDTTYISLNTSGEITALAPNYGDVIQINAICGSKQSTLKVVTEPYEVQQIPLNNIIPVETSKNIFVTELFKPLFSFDPIDSNQKSYTLSSSNTNVATIDGKTVKGLNEGEAIITATSNKNPEIKCSIRLTVNKQPIVTEFTTNESLTMIEGASRSIGISNVQPSYGDATNVIYTSDNEDVATVSNYGIIKSIKAGSTDIKVTIGAKTKTINLVVNAKPSSEVDRTTSFDIETIKKPVIYANKPVKVSSFIKVLDFKSGDETYTPNDTSMTYSLADSSFGTIEGDTLTSKTVGEFTLYITHNVSGITKEVMFTSIDDFLIDGSATINQHDIHYGELFEFNIDKSNDELTRDLTTNEWWSVSHVDDSIITVKDNGDAYDVTGVGEGEAEIIVTPHFGNTSLDDLCKKIKVHVSHIKTESFNVNITRTSTDGNVYELEQNKTNKCYVNDELKLTTKIDDNATSSNITFSSSNSSILEVTNSGALTSKSIGKVTITATETVSGKTQKFDLSIENRISLNQDTPFTINGTTATLDDSDGYYEIMNGTIGNIVLNYSSDTSYKTVQWRSNNEKIVTIGGDGTISPLKAGKSTITAIIDDGYSSEKSEITIKLKISKQPVIKDLQEFFAIVRKAIGHFGAFMVFGVFSALTFMMWWRGKKWYWSTPLTFVQGFGLAALTECIQLSVPGRAGAFTDVLIDSAGCFIGIIVTGALIIALTLLRWKKNKTQNKN